MTENSLIIFTRASQMLAEANTIQKTKELKDLALTAADWARRKGMGKEAIQYANSYALAAEHKMGQLLQETERANVERDNKRAELLSVTPPPTLTELGITRRDSSEAQKLAKMPDELFEEVCQGKKARAAAKKEMRNREIAEAKAEIAKVGALVAPDERWHIYQGDIATWQAPKLYDFIITDPPYSKTYLPLWEILAQRSIEWLKPGGLLIAMSGQSYLDKIYAILSKHMEYYWTACYLTLGHPTPLRQVNVNTTWKPLLIYSKGKYTGRSFGDVFKSGGNDKEYHKWGQSVSGMSDIISKICLAGQYILDPFCGAGTTGIAALRHGCLFDGLELDTENVKISRARIASNDKT